jgi:hypothetical protein
MRTDPDTTKVHAAREALDQWLNSLASTDWRRPAFFLGIPTLLAIYGASTSMVALEGNGVWQTLRFYVAHAYLPWWITCLSTRLVYIVLARFRPKAPLLWVMGASISCLLLIPYLNWVGMQPTATVAGGDDVSVTYFFIHAGRIVIIWVMVNYLFERFVGLPRYRYPVLAAPDVLPLASNSEQTGNAVTSVVAEVQEVPAFLAKCSKVSSVEDLYSVSAEEHYVRIHTATGDELVYKRFSDAVMELEGLNGIRVHRSHWVAPYAVSGVVREGKRMFIKLADGSQLPVSRPYQAMVSGLARNCGHPGQSVAGSHLS